MDEDSNEWFYPVLNRQVLPEEAGISTAISGKVVLSIWLVQEAVKCGDKTIIFSQSIPMLDVLEELLAKRFQWEKNRDFLRLDGSTSSARRQRDIHLFNRQRKEAEEEAGEGGTIYPWVYLVSTRAGCLGVNMVGANRIIIFDASWNPSNDSQATYRAYRYGQKKSVHVYRLIANGTMEKKIYERQVLKTGTALRVVDEKQIDRMFSANDVQELFTFEDSEDEDQEEEQKVKKKKKEEEGVADPPLPLQSSSSSSSSSKPAVVPVVEGVSNRIDPHMTHDALPRDPMMVRLLRCFGDSFTVNQIHRQEQRENLAQAAAADVITKAFQVARTDGDDEKGEEEEGGKGGKQRKGGRDWTAGAGSQRKDWIRGYHVPEQMLANQEDEALTAAEQIEAEADFQQELSFEHGIRAQLPDPQSAPAAQVPGRTYTLAVGQDITRNLADQDLVAEPAYPPEPKMAPEYSLEQLLESMTPEQREVVEQLSTEAKKTFLEKFLVGIRDANKKRKAEWEGQVNQLKQKYKEDVWRARQKIVDEQKAVAAQAEAQARAMEQQRRQQFEQMQQEVLRQQQQQQLKRKQSTDPQSYPQSAYPFQIPQLSRPQTPTHVMPWQAQSPVFYYQQPQYQIGYPTPVPSFPGRPSTDPRASLVSQNAMYAQNLMQTNHLQQQQQQQHQENNQQQQPQ